MRLVLGLVVLMAVAGCTGGDGNGSESLVTPDPNETVDATWDFRSPQTATDLGSSVDAFVELDGPAALRVVFPSGREVEGVYAWGAIGQTALAPTPGHETGVINEVILQEGTVSGADELRASAEAFSNEWGPATFRGESIEEFVDRFDVFARTSDDATDLNDFAPIGENVFAFRARTQDGIDPTWSPRVVSDAITLRVSLTFDPGVP